MPWTGTGTPITGTSHDLTTLVSAKEYLRISGTDDDSLIGNVIDRASAEIENICNRYFNTASYAKWFDGNASTQMYLDHWPVTAVSRVSSGRLNVLGIWCNSTSITWASARVTAAGLTLVQVDSSGSSTNTLSFSTYTTIATLAAAIDALGSGWASLDLSYGTYLSSDLAQTPALYCLNLYAYLPHPYQALCDYKWEESSGRLNYYGRFVRGVQNIYIEYTGGYTTIPFDVEQACLMLTASTYFGTRRDPSLKSEKLGDYAWAANTGEAGSVRSQLTKMLEKYIRIAI